MKKYVAHRWMERPFRLIFAKSLLPQFDSGKLYDIAIQKLLIGCDCHLEYSYLGFKSIDYLAIFNPRNHDAYTTDGRYRAAHAESMACGRRRVSRRRTRFDGCEWALVEDCLRMDYRSEQVSGHLKRTTGLSIRHETIYQHVWRDKRAGGDLHSHLRGARKLRRKRPGRKDSRGRLPGKRNISERPASLERRVELGHWEADTVMGKGKGCVLPLVERFSGYVWIGQFKSRTADEVVSRACSLLAGFPAAVRTITADNGCEFHSYKRIEQRCDLAFYFANPHHSWERGTTETINRCIRQYLPKGMSLDDQKQTDCNRIARKLNDRPRKRHEFQSPKQVIFNL